MKVARTYDGVYEATGPYFTDDHARIDDVEERVKILEFLRSGTMIDGTDAKDIDWVVITRGRVVPVSLRTDGRWVWSDALGYYLEMYGLAPEREFVDHIAACGYVAEAPSAQVCREAFNLLCAH